MLYCEATRIHHRFPETFRSALPLQVWGGEGVFERGRERTRYFEGPLPFWSPFSQKKGSQKNVPKKNPHWSIFWDPENPQKVARAEFSGVLHGAQKRGPRPGVQKVRCCCYLLHLSWVQGLRKGPRFSSILGTCFPKKTKKGGSRKVLKISPKKAFETDPKRDPI